MDQDLLGKWRQYKSRNHYLSNRHSEIQVKKKNINWNNEGHFVMLKVLFNNEAVSIMNMYAVNNTVKTYIKQMYRKCMENG